MWSCSRSHGHPFGERSFAMTFSRSFDCKFSFHFGFTIYDLRFTSALTIGASIVNRKLQNNQIVPMHHFHALQGARFDFL